MFIYKSLNDTSGFIIHNDELIAEIRDLCLCNVRFKPNGALLIGENVPMPLYWQQYANHQHQERNAGSHGSIECLETGEQLKLIVGGESFSREVKSEYVMEVRYVSEKYFYHFNASLKVNEGNQWLVTPNQSHGELEFCNLFPLDTFITEDDCRNSPSSLREKKKYSECFVQHHDEVICIPHHHLESSDKHNIEMNACDKFYWLLEDENPAVEIYTNFKVTAGLCAYMWDAHFAYRVCDKNENIFLHSGMIYTAEFQIFSIDRDEGEKILRQSQICIAPEIATTPIYINGVNTFSETLDSVAYHQHDVWPWSNEIIEGVSDTATLEVDHNVGYDDNHSLRIDHKEKVSSHWIASTLGPAFGEAPFEEGCRYRLSAFIRTRNVQGETFIALRLHREGYGNIFELNDYEVYRSEGGLNGTNEWQYIEVVTPIISPAPDRMHLILQQSGFGTSWFDNVLFERDVVSE